MSIRQLVLLWCCTFSTLVALGQMPNMPTQERMVVNDCNDQVALCLPIPLENWIQYEVTDNGNPLIHAIVGCDYDTSTTYYYNIVFGQGNQGPYQLNNWTINGQSYSGAFQNIAALVAMMNNWDTNGNWTLNASTLSIVGGHSNKTYGNLQILATATQTPSTLGPNATYFAQGTSMTFDVGMHQVSFFQIGTGLTHNMEVEVECRLLSQTVYVSTSIGQTVNYCFDWEGLTSPLFSVNNICMPSSPHATYEYNGATDCLMMTGISAGTDSTCWVACDAMGFCDTTYVVLNVMSMPTGSTYQNTITGNGLPYAYCPNWDDLPGAIDTFYNACANESGTFVHFYLDNNGPCVKYQGIQCGGTETACMVACSGAVCDTVYVEITVDNINCSFPTESVVDTVWMGQTMSFCLDTTQLPGNIVSIDNACPSSGGMFVEFDWDPTTYCVTYTGLNSGTDKACMVLTDDLGNTDTTLFCITTLAMTTDVIVDTLTLNTSMTYCMDTTELHGTIVSMTNICPNLSGDNVQFALNDVTLCVEATAVSIGTDTACIVVCDNMGVCDTTLLYVTVTDTTGGGGGGNPPPIAVNDTLTISPNTPVLISVLNNDIIPAGSNLSVFLIAQANGGVGPHNGLISLNPDNTVNYIPTVNFCGVDSFSYGICNQYGCDTAVVYVEVNCQPITDDITIYDGFSPNGDGINEFFKIKGIELYPDNELWIYNRWGNQVFAEKGYKNQWDGTWNGQILPAGVYFYYLKIGSNREYFGDLMVQH